MIAYIVLGVAVVLQSLITLQLQKQHAAERKDLLDRIMSKTFEEYKALTETDESIKLTGDPVVNTDEEEWAREIEMMAESR